MNQTETKKISKFLSLVLRHQPETIGIELDAAGWIDVAKLLDAMARHGKPLTREKLEFVVRTNDKQRFTFSEDGCRIRANQGHSVEVELGYEPAEPPEILLHGTPRRFLEMIRQDGLKKMARHDVHLHTDEETASAVGQRRGKPVLLRIRAAEMAKQGYEFFVTPNDIWLTDEVPPEFIEIDAVIAQTKYLRLIDRAGWTFAQRVGNTGIVCIIATMSDDRLILVEQYRPPVGCTVIELPAGLAGDIPGQQDEPLQTAAERELLEETGYVADQWQQLATVASSAGMTDEVVTLFRASGLTRQTAGGGDESEDIQVHTVPVDQLLDWLDKRTAAGVLVDSRVYAALAFID